MHRPSHYVWLSVLSGLCVATLIMAATALRQLSSLPAPCECKPVEPCPCENVVSCTCDHAALLKLISDVDAKADELRVSIEAVEDRLSKGESRILSEWLKAQDVIASIKRRLDKLEGHSKFKPPVRRQASCGAHPPSCEGIAALGADGEPDGVTGVLLTSPAVPFASEDQLVLQGEVNGFTEAERLRWQWCVIKPFGFGESGVVARVGIGFHHQAAEPFCPFLPLLMSVHGESPLAGDSTVADVTPATGIHEICTSTPWYPGKCIQDMRLEHAKAVQKRIEQRQLLLKFLFGAA